MIMLESIWIKEVYFFQILFLKPPQNYSFIKYIFEYWIYVKMWILLLLLLLLVLFLLFLLILLLLLLCGIVIR